MILFNKVVYHFLGKYINGIEKIEFDKATSQEIESLKSTIYTELKKPYFSDTNHLSRIDEADLSARSILLSLTNRNRLIATCRLTPYPFEINRVSPVGKAIEKYHDYLEISRLICVQQKMSANMLIHAGIVGFNCDQHKYRGFIGLCRQQHIKSFQRFSFKVVAGPLIIPDRGSAEYFIVVGSFTVAGLRACGYILATKFKSALPNAIFPKRKKLF